MTGSLSSNKRHAVMPGFLDTVCKILGSLCSYFKQQLRGPPGGPVLRLYTPNVAGFNPGWGSISHMPC